MPTSPVAETVVGTGTFTRRMSDAASVQACSLIMPSFRVSGLVNVGSSMRALVATKRGDVVDEEAASALVPLPA